MECEKYEFQIKQQQFQVEQRGIQDRQHESNIYRIEQDLIKERNNNEDNRKLMVKLTELNEQQQWDIRKQQQEIDNKIKQTEMLRDQLIQLEKLLEETKDNE